MIKKILIFLITFIALVLIIAALLPANFYIERSVVINAAPQKVYEQVADLNKYLKWNPWSEIEPDAKNSLGEISSGEGAAWSWEGKEIGKGKLTILKADKYTSVETKVEFIEPWKGVNYGFWTFIPQEGGTKVVWAFEGTFSYPFERFMYFYIDRKLGEDFDRGLANLKRKCESEEM
jgi:hypothetical protein